MKEEFRVLKSSYAEDIDGGAGDGMVEAVVVLGEIFLEMVVMGKRWAVVIERRRRNSGLY